MCNTVGEAGCKLKYNCVCCSVGVGQRPAAAAATVSSSASMPLRPAPTPPGSVKRSSPSPTMVTNIPSTLPAPLIPSWVAWLLLLLLFLLYKIAHCSRCAYMQILMVICGVLWPASCRYHSSVSMCPCSTIQNQWWLNINTTFQYDMAYCCCIACSTQVIV